MMATTTLRGIFPDPKPVHRRNFIKENMKQLKEMQGFIQNELKSQSYDSRKNKYKHITPKVYQNMARKFKRENLSAGSFGWNRSAPVRAIHKGVQTERSENIAAVRPNGAVKNPSKSKMGGDTGGLVKNMEKLELDDKSHSPNYIKQNKKNLKTKVREEPPDPTLPPDKYQKGVVPKYLKDKEKKEMDATKAVEYECENAKDLVLLPDEERKEYLRVARENYAALIKELNSMPVSNDTLRKRKRKMEIEDELKRLDDVIKIFQKPKVFVKADA